MKNFIKEFILFPYRKYYAWQYQKGVNACFNDLNKGHNNYIDYYVSHKYTKPFLDGFFNTQLIFDHKPFKFPFHKTKYNNIVD